MADEVIQISGLSRSFISAKNAVEAVNDLNLTIGAGEIFGLIGPDGAGKTTLMRLMVGALMPDKGEVLLDDIRVEGDPDRIRKIIGYMPQKFSLYGDLTVEENMKFFAELYGVVGGAFDCRREELLRFSRLDLHCKKYAKSLSGGMQKKLALSCNLFHLPKILILDEPTNGVDPVSRRELWGLLYDLQQKGTTIMVSTPYMDEAERCNRVGLMYEGKILACDSPLELPRKFLGESIERTVEQLGDDKRSPFERAFMKIISDYQGRAK